MAKGPKPRPIEDRFWEKVDKSGKCWIWTAAKSEWGYGLFGIGKGISSVRAHRFSYELANGPIPDGLWVLHKCDNPPCVRPDHLFLGNHSENMQDMHAKGRGRSEYSLKEACYRGHPYTPENTFFRGAGRICRECAIERDRARADGAKPTNFIRTHCLRGHEFTPENTIIHGTGRRTCRKCVQMRDRARYPRIKKTG